MFKTYDSSIPDDQIVDDFKELKAWGLETLINIYGADKNLITDPEVIRDFIVELCDLIEMNRFGEPVIERFGEGNLFGYSAVQLIYTSNIVMHFAEEDGRIFLDIFSCKEFAPSLAARFTKNFFDANDVEYSTVLRD